MMSVKAIKKSLYKSVTRGRLRPIAKLIYDSLVSLELAWERALDAQAHSRQPPVSPALNTQVTAVIKTFERPAALHRLLTSIRRFYPDLPVIVVDDSRQPAEIPGVTLLTLPFDSGVSAGRQAGLEQVNTPFLLMLDDDFIFYRRTCLQEVFTCMLQNPDIDVLGGACVDLPFYQTTRLSTPDQLYPTNAQPTLPPGSRIAGMPVVDKVPNFFLARTGRLRLVGWDSQIKRLDHADFFTRARGVLTTVAHPRLKCLHAKTPFDIDYMDHRMDLLLDTALIRMRYYRSTSHRP